MPRPLCMEAIVNNIKRVGLIALLAILLMVIEPAGAHRVVKITDAQPLGTHTITVRATDNCSATTDASFTLTVSDTTTLVVTTNANSGPGSLRQAIADAPAGGIITFDMTRVVSPISRCTGTLNC
jgi:hypothetical protein